MIIPVKNLGQIGLIRDIEPHELPINAWSDIQNMRVREGAVEKFQGESAAYDPPSIAPYTLFPIRNAANYFWVYAGATAVYATDSVSHADITRAVGGAYTVDADIRWTGGTLGNRLIINNGTDVPQMWDGADLGTALAALTGWDATWKCRALRSFKNYLLALDVTKGAVRYATMCKWSDAASADQVPQSWDETDPTTDAGESNGVLSQTSDALIDCLPLSDVNIIYKEGSTYGQQFIGSNDIFRFWRMFSQSGILTRWCMAQFMTGGVNRHFVVTQDDAIIHDGHSPQSVSEDRMRRTIRDLIDADNFQKACVVPDYQNAEMWFCYPASGSTWSNKAWVWNWKHNTWAQRNLPGIAHATWGRADAGLSGLWSEDNNSWESDSKQWDEADFDPTARGVIMADFANTKLWRANQDYQADGSNYMSYVERKGLDFDSQQHLKRPTRILPYIEGTNGKTVTVKVGGHNAPDDTPTYDVSASFVIGTDNWIDCEEAQSWRYLSVYFGDEDNQKWRMSRYDIDLFMDGER